MRGPLVNIERLSWARGLEKGGWGGLLIRPPFFRQPRDSLTAGDREAAVRLWHATLTRDGGARYTNELVKDRGASHRRRYDSGLQ